MRGPTSWERQMAVIRMMRQSIAAPVDTVGCASLADPTASAKEQRFEVLVAGIVSAQTKDQVVADAIKRLRGGGLLSVPSMRSASRADVESLLHPASFFSRKAEFLQRTAGILETQHDGDVPATVKELMALPGVGHKVANLVLPVAWGKVEGICVDTHVHRIRWAVC